MNTSGKVILWTFSLVGLVAVLGSEMHTVWKVIMFCLIFAEAIFLGTRWLYRRSQP